MTLLENKGNCVNFERVLFLVILTVLDLLCCDSNIKSWQIKKINKFLEAILLIYHCTCILILCF